MHPLRLVTHSPETVSLAALIKRAFWEKKSKKGEIRVKRTSNRKSGRIQKLLGVLLAVCMVFTASLSTAFAYTSDQGNGNYSNPVIFADYPDVCTIKVGSSYYMVSSSISYIPALPILKSDDLVNWEIVSYAVDRIDVGMDGIDRTHADAYNMQNGKNVYAKGTWAPSLKYKNGTFYVTFASLDLGKTFVCTHKAPLDNTKWNVSAIQGIGYAHDADLFFDTDGKTYLVSGGCSIIELNDDCRSVKRGGLNKKLFDGGNSHDGNRIFRTKGYYYILSTPIKDGGWQRIEKCWRSRTLTGNWEQKVILDDGANHQVCIVEDGQYNWAMLFEDHGAVGRIPKLAPVTWQNNWPMIGINGNAKVPASYRKPAAGSGVKRIGTTDEFNSGNLNLQWQWNHNPDNSKWSMSARKGWLRLGTSYAKDLTSARNTLGERMQGPTCCGWVKLDVSNLKPGQIAGLSMFHAKYGYIGVRNDYGTKKLVQYNVGGREYVTNLSGNTVYLKIDASSLNDTASFYYSYNENSWTKFGDNLKMEFFYKLWYIGYRFGLFNYTTGSDTSGYADFDFFRFSQQQSGTSRAVADPELNGGSAPVITQAPTAAPTAAPQPSQGESASVADGWYYIKNVNSQKYLQVAGNAGKNAANIEIGTGSGSEGQKWYLQNRGSGYFTLKSALGNYNCDIAYGKDENEANVQIYDAHGADAQQFSARKIDGTSNTYAIATKCSSGTKVFDVYGRRTADGTNVMQWQYTGGTNQQWIFEPVSGQSAQPTAGPTQRPTAAPTQRPADPTKAPQPSGKGLVLSYSINDWGSGYQVNMKVKNEGGTAVNGWTLKIKKSDINVASFWNVKVAESGDSYVITPLDWNRSIPAGGSIEFGICGSGHASSSIGYTFS